jgi:hypothetical protein
MLKVTFSHSHRDLLAIACCTFYCVTGMITAAAHSKLKRMQHCNGVASTFRTCISLNAGAGAAYSMLRTATET